MFSQPIVFVIGAGVGEEYQMPLGADLKARVASAVNLSKPGTDQELWAMLSARFQSGIRMYEDAGRDLAKTIESFPSIDEALEWFGSRSEVVELGKVSIIREILTAERTCPLDDRVKNAWLSHFLSMAISGWQSEKVERAFENVTMINFNYDRVIEHFLFSALQSKFGIEQARASRVVSGLRMIRPYGRVGALEWQEPPDLQDKLVVPFGARLGPDHEVLFSLSKGVRTFTEQDLASKIMPEIRDALEKARTIVFLGFGFHSQNMRLLQVRTAESWRRWFATAMGMDTANHPIMRTAISRAVGCSLPEDQTVLLGWRAHKMLDDMRPSIMAASSM